MLLKKIVKQGLTQPSFLVDGGDDSKLVFRVRSHHVEGHTRQTTKPENSQYETERNQVRRAGVAGWLLGPAIVVLTLLFARGCTAPVAGGDTAEMTRLPATVNHQIDHQEQARAPAKLGLSTPQRQGG